MPPHCDTLDGPVVKAAKRALETGEVHLILPWVAEAQQEELESAFEKAYETRSLAPKAAEVSDLWFFETAVRLHREGEGASYTGLKPEGLDWGPVVPLAEDAIAMGSADKVVEFVTRAVADELQERFARVMAATGYDPEDVAAARRYVQAELGFVLFSHGVYAYVTGGGDHQE